MNVNIRNLFSWCHYRCMNGVGLVKASMNFCGLHTNFNQTNCIHTPMSTMNIIPSLK